MIDVFDQLCTRAGSVHTSPNWLLPHTNLDIEPGRRLGRTDAALGISLRQLVLPFGQDADVVGFVGPPEVRPTVGRLWPQRLVLRQLHPWYRRVVLTVADRKMDVRRGW